MRRCIFMMTACLTAGSATAGSEDFARPPELEPDIEFWRRVYTEVTTQQGFIHDSRDLSVIYEVISFPEHATRRQRQKQVERVKEQYRKVLRVLASGKRDGLSGEAQRVLYLWPQDVSNRTLDAARHRLRFQLGQADMFRDGLIRSGAWEPYIRQTLEEMGVPVEISALPHVESSYNPTARSHVGASGLWQFTRSTGRRYMRIDHVVDDRRDPYLSTVAAARLLLHNYSVTGTWPLALTAYNHGAAGMRRAKHRLGTDDIATIVREYTGRTFGFASRNFYVAFLAAVDVSSDPDRYFGAFRRVAPDDIITVRMSDYVTPASLQRALGVDLATLKAHNPALLPSVWNGSKRVPRNYELRLPSAAINGDVETLLASIPASERFATQTADLFHTVQRGETLSQIAAYHRISQGELVALNNLRSRHRIRAGQVLRLPVSSGAVLASAEPPEDGVYIVRRGDSISAIAKRFGVSESELLALNQIDNRNRIYQGQRLSLAVAELPATDAPAVSAEIMAATTVPTANVESPSPILEQAPAAGSSTASVTLASSAREPTGVEVPVLIAVDVVEVDAVADRVETGAAQEEVPTGVPATPIVTTPSDEVLATDEAETEMLLTGTVATPQPALSADPSDYSVGPDGKIEIQAAETLGHYAEWLDLRASQLRRINKMAYGTPVVVGERLKLDFSRVTPEQFEQRRIEYQQILQAEFFTRFRITGVQTHVIEQGELLWVLSQRRYHVPVWLLRQYNPDLNLALVRPGTEVTFPVLAEASVAE